MVGLGHVAVVRVVVQARLRGGRVGGSGRIQYEENIKEKELRQDGTAKRQARLALEEGEKEDREAKSNELP